MAEKLKQFLIRPIIGSDSPEELTALLHRAYKQLADQGFRYQATHQDVATTLKRITDATCYVAIMNHKIVGTITYRSPARAMVNRWYNLPFVASFGQFGVEPELQQQGIGSKLLDRVENDARQDNAMELSLDTSEGASELIDYYTKRGYRFIEYVQWPNVNYRSMILSKTVSEYWEQK